MFNNKEYENILSFLLMDGCDIGRVIFFLFETAATIQFLFCFTFWSSHNDILSYTESLFKFCLRCAQQMEAYRAANHPFLFTTTL